MPEQKKKIAVIIDGGIGAGFQLQGIPVVNDFIEALSEEFRIVVFQLTKADRNYSTDKFKLEHYPFRSKMGATLWLAYKLGREHQRDNFDCILALRGYPAGYLATTLGSIFKLKSIVSFQGGDATWIPEIGYGSIGKHKHRIQKVVERSCAVTMLSQFHCNRLMEHVQTNKRICVIPYGVRPQQFVPGKLFDQHSKLRIIHVADLNKVKNQLLLIDTFEKILESCDADLTIVGRDTLDGKIQRIVSEKRLTGEIRFTGMVSRNELAGLMKKHQFLLHTSMFESQAMVVNEAIACGLVVVGTPVGIAGDLNHICTATADNASGLAHCVLELHANREKYVEMRNKGLEWTKTNTLDHTIEKYAALINEVTG